MKKQTCINITNLSNPDQRQISASSCTSFLERLSGLQLKQTIDENEGLLFINARASRIGSSIHTLFMKFNLTVVWIDNFLQVCQVKTAVMGLPWLVPEKPAKYILEAHPIHIDTFAVGDRLHFEKIY